MTNGGWKMAIDGWKIANGVWRMAGRWLENGCWFLKDV